MKTDPQTTTTTIAAARSGVPATNETSFHAPLQSHYNPLRRHCGPSETAQKRAPAAYECYQDHLSGKLRACSSRKKTPL